MNEYLKYNYFGHLCTCDHCHNESRTITCYESRFNIGYDWEDSISDNVCIKCLIIEKLTSIIYKIKNIKKDTFFIATKKTIAIAYNHKYLIINIKPFSIKILK